MDMMVWGMILISMNDAYMYRSFVGSKNEWSVVGMMSIMVMAIMVVHGGGSWDDK